MKRIGLAISATVLALIAGCTPTPAGITGPCPTKLTSIPAGEEEAVATVNEYGQQLIGFDETAALTCVEDAGLTWRVVARDGESFPITMDYRIERLNAVITDSIVTEITVG
jgi:hypothetical protein